MNPKILAALLLIPVAVFATDRIVSTSHDGGGKEKHKNLSNQPATTGNEVSAESATEQQEVATAIVPETKQAVRLDTREAVDAVKALLDSLEIGSVSFLDGEYERAYVYASSEAASADTIRFLMENVVRPLKEVNPMTIRLDRSFSRCPSGYHVEMLTKEGRPTANGIMVVDDGCWDRPIGIFHYDMISQNVEVLAGEGLGYLPLDQYLKLLKAAAA